MKNIKMLTALIALLPTLTYAEMSMQKPAADESVVEAATTAEPAVESSAPTEAVKKVAPKKFVSTNAAAIEEHHSGKYAEEGKSK